jgi:hypothetical protein
MSSCNPSVEVNLMGFNEALAWFGYTIAGVGVYIVFERHLKTVWAAVIIVLGLAAVVYSVYHHDHPTSPNPPVLWVLLLICTWAMFGYVVYDAHRKRLPVAVPQATPVKTLEDRTEILAHDLYEFWKSVGPEPKWFEKNTEYPAWNENFQARYRTGGFPDRILGIYDEMVANGILNPLVKNELESVCDWAKVKWFADELLRMRMNLQMGKWAV